MLPTSACTKYGLLKEATVVFCHFREPVKYPGSGPKKKEENKK